MFRLQSFLLGIILLTSFSLHAQRTRVIYGDDDRLDPYEVTDQKLLDLTKSTAAVVSKSDLVVSRSSSPANPKGTITLKTEHYGKSMQLCTSERFYNQPTGAFCSASLIGPKLVLTAGHCITSDNECKGAAFVFGFNMKSKDEAVTNFQPENVVACKKIISRIEDGHGADFAVVEIEREIKHIQPLKLSNNKELKVGSKLVVIGHPSGLPVKISGGAAVRDLQGSAGYFSANLDTYGGNSGSAVFNSVTGEVEGVLVRGETDFIPHGSCYVSNVCENSGCMGEEVTKASFVTQQLNRTLNRTGFQSGQNSGRGGFQGSRNPGNN